MKACSQKRNFYNNLRGLSREFFPPRDQVEDRFLGMQTVLRLLKDDRSG